MKHDRVQTSIEKVMSKVDYRKVAKVIFLGMFIAFVFTVGVLPDAEAAAGDFSGDFAAAAPFTFDHATGGGAWNNGTIGDSADVRESLQGGDWECNDTVTFLQEIVVGGDGSDDPQTIELDFEFSAHSTGQQGVALGQWVGAQINYGQVQNGDDYTGTGTPYVDGLDGGIFDDRQGPTLGPGGTPGDTGSGGSTATVLSTGLYNPQDPPTAVFEKATVIQATIEIDDLEAGETVILRMDVKILCDPGSNPTGNMYANLDEARLTYINDTVPVTPPDAIGSGAQTIPFQGAGDVGYSTLSITKTCPVFTHEQPYTYQVDITNDGTVPASGVYFTDAIPAEVDFVSCADDPDFPGDTCVESPAGSNNIIATLNADLNEVGTAEPPPTTWTITFVVDIVVADVDVTNTVHAYANNSPLYPTSYTGECTSHTPVTVSYVNATSSDDGVLIEWSTASETANAGFNIYVETESGRQKVNDSLILTRAVNSLEPLDYSFEAAGVQGEKFYIEDVSIVGARRTHGPFTLNEAHGEKAEIKRIDWTAVHIENDLLSAERETAARAQVFAQAEAESPFAFAPSMPWMQSGIEKLFGNAPAASNVSAEALVLEVEKDGIYRVEYDALLAQDAALAAALAGTPMSELSLKNQGVAVPIYVSGNTFGPGAYVEFYGEAVNTLYSGTNVYRLEADVSAASRVDVDNGRFARKDQTPDFYMETRTVENNARYAYQSTNGDPWYDSLLIADPRVTGQDVRLYNLATDNHVSGAAAVNLEVEMWGIQNFLKGPDHHVTVDFNGENVADVLFDAQDTQNLNIPLSADDLLANNEVLLSLPNDLGLGWDMVAVEQVSVTYPRALVAQDDALSFDTAGDAIRVQGLSSKNVVAYRVEDGISTKLGRVKVSRDGGSYAAKFVGSSGTASYVVATEDALLSPAVSLARVPGELTSNDAVDLLIISHPNFISGLQPLVDAREAQGLSVLVVDVEDVYDEYSGGVFDALAIKAYIADAMETMGVRYVLLVGGDTTDYHNYLGDSISFMPSLYAQTMPEVRFAPVDPLYTDVDGDGAPNAAIGRFPVRTVGELAIMVNKTLQYAGRDTLAQSAVFAADTGFENDSNLFITKLGSGWDVEKAYIGDDGISNAQATLIDALNEGAALTSFVGHSAFNNWVSPSFFKISTIDTLEANNQPTVVAQWGCWNTYYVDPTRETLGPALLLTSEAKGAAAVTGSTTLTYDDHERALGRLMMPKLMTPGKSVGDAMLEAKLDLNKDNPEMVDVILGWTLLGDPTIEIQAD